MFRKRRHKYYGSGAEHLEAAVEQLCARLRFSDPEGLPRSIVVTSSVPGEGKSTVSALIARQLSRSGTRVLAMDCDLRRPALGRRLGAGSHQGIGAVLLGELTLSQAVKPVDNNLWLLDAELKPYYPSDLFATKRFGDLLDKATEMFDCLVVDTPPLGAVIDAAVIASRADGALLVMREGITKRKDLLSSKTQLVRSGSRILGCVVNGYKDE
ncbi:CpsD/CapB family tyrosine-protein kinase [Collinsella tanakaei]|nr:CpsD/CapB family tyrosine-protein kinase [Collinsella tanakaei]